MSRIILSLVFLSFAGCASMDAAMSGANAVPSKADREKAAVSMTELSASQKSQFIDGKPWIGMTDQELSSMWNAKPAKTQTKLSAKGNEEVRLYKLRVGDWKSGITSKYYRVNMVDGKLTELQELDPNAGNFENL